MADYTQPTKNDHYLPSRFMPASKHLRNRQARQWLRCVRSTGHWPKTLFESIEFASVNWARLTRGEVTNLSYQSWKLTWTLRLAGVPAIPVNASLEESRAT